MKNMVMQLGILLGHFYSSLKRSLEVVVEGEPKSSAQKKRFLKKGIAED
jgi:hypothetical protein